MYINDYLLKLQERGRRVKRFEDLDREYEPTRIIYGNRNTIVYFTIRDSIAECYSNIFVNRRAIYDLLGVSDDVEAYNKVLNAMSNPGRLEMYEFYDYYKNIDIGLQSLPFIKYYREDAGYYLTSSIYISCIDKICNASYHRTMLINDEKAVPRIVPRHLYHIVEEYHSKGMDAPAAIILGVDPYTELAAAMTPPLGVFELSIAAKLSGYNRVVKTPIHNIVVPANASIIVEGIISRDEEFWEGPFVDILMIPDKRRKQPVFRAEAVYVHREIPPLYHAIVPGLWEHIYLMGFPREPLIYNSVRRVSPGVKSVRLTMGSGGWLHAVVSIHKKVEGEARNAGLAVISAHPSVKHVIIVDDDIDIDDPYAIEWAIATRVRGSEDIIILRDLRGSTLDPRGRDGVGDKVIIDATKPLGDPWDKYKRAGIP